MREQELIVYREFEDGGLLHDMAFLMSHYNDAYYNKEDLAALFYEDIHMLLDLAGTYGFAVYWAMTIIPSFTVVLSEICSLLYIQTMVYPSIMAAFWTSSGMTRTPRGSTYLWIWLP